MTETSQNDFSESVEFPIILKYVITIKSVTITVTPSTGKCLLHIFNMTLRMVPKTLWDFGVCDLKLYSSNLARPFEWNFRSNFLQQF